MVKERNILFDITISPFYETEPVGYEEQPSFINCALIGYTTLQPIELFNQIKSIEKFFGRKERPRWHERELDIDIILFDDMIIENDYLTIPHPRMNERRFVLLPSCDIAPDMVHPETHKTIAELHRECKDNHSIYPFKKTMLHNR